MSWLLIAIGSALGGIGRHAVGLAVALKWGGTFPWGTLTVNVAGSFAIGAFAAFTGLSERPPTTTHFVREFVMIGFLGGFTTFSAFSLQTLQLLRDGKIALAFANAGLSIVACLFAVWLGYALLARFNGAPS
jgi:fluoride exporter